MGDPLAFDLSSNEDRTIVAGRWKKDEIVLEHRGISNQHFELKLLKSPKVQLGIRDTSSNGTGFKLPNQEEVVRLAKGVDTPVPDGAIIVCPVINKDSAPQLEVRVQVSSVNDKSKKKKTEDQAGSSKKQKEAKQKEADDAASREPSPAAPAGETADNRKKRKRRTEQKRR